MVPLATHSFLLSAAVWPVLTGAIDSRSPFRGPQAVNLWKLQRQQSSVQSTASRAPALLIQSPGNIQPVSAELQTDVASSANFPVYTFEQPLDHFFNTTNATFGQRYWVSTRHYVPNSGAPVIVIDGGETSGEDRLPYLDTGIADILAKATGGVGVVLEHRYYGESVGVEDFTTDNLRWLNNEQALEDSAVFMQNVKFEGIEEDLTAPNTPWIYYGGSYAGARAAHMKILYPKTVWGSIASSAVTHAALTNWEYMDVIRTYADPVCSANLVHSIATVDTLIKIPIIKDRLKGLFNLSGLASDQDFVSVLESPLGSWQSKNWDPAVGSTAFDDFCAQLNGNTSSLADTRKTIPFFGTHSVNIALLSYASYIRNNIVSQCQLPATVEDCFGTQNDTSYQVADLSQTWRLWTFQYCTQWGYLTTSPPNPKKYPPIISRLLDLDYEHKICVQAFPPGEFFTVPRLPDVHSVNVLGNFDIAADRLAFVDGEVDPWRPDTPHSQYYAKNRTDTTLRPFKLIPGAVHHWDENGLADPSAEPPEIAQIHAEEVAFVKTWLADFHAGKSKRTD
ncbi:peptidase S28 [Vararia minispora EC-137]|uniref:Peptidase S28 n=1 Tax=Vararia minispora EC-137 TaxID=1314806 RepID=A0ACB8QH66_9AGAM|nr:peptidase S28 [Vararia minispora EC-137]